MKQLAQTEAPPVQGVELPPHLYPPPGAQSKNLANYVPVATPGSGFQVIFAFQVPAGMRLVLNQIGNNFVGGGFTEGTGQLTWQIWDNGQPIEDFDDITGSLGNVALPTPMAPILFEEGHTVSFVYENAAGSGIPMDSAQIGATLRGWYYDRLLAGETEWPI